jgi:hypothetical protein
VRSELLATMTTNIIFGGEDVTSYYSLRRHLPHS